MQNNAFYPGMPTVWLPPKLLLTVKITLLLITLGLLQVSAATFGQHITLSEQNTPLKEVLKKIKLQSGVNFLYADDILEQSKKVNIKLSNTPLAEALDKIFDQQPLSYELKENTVVLKLKTPSFPDKLAAVWRNTDVHCSVEDEKGHALAGASVRVKGTDKGTITNEKGEFELKNVDEEGILLISYLGYKVKEIPAKEVNGAAVIKMELVSAALSEVAVVSTGYQNLNKERATGSFTTVDHKLLNRSMSTDVLSRLDGVTSGVFFPAQSNITGGDPEISIRGRSTIRANTDALVVLDNFPFNGDLKNINPNDIESVTVLKDAAAASIWGVRAGNGVIVLTSKKGKLNSAPLVSFTSTFSVAEKENWYKKSGLNSAQYIEIERFLFDKGKYDSYLSFLPYVVQSPVIDLLEQRRKNLITQDQLDSRLNALSQLDARDDYTRYFLRNAQNQQYALSIGGGGAQNQYYFSAGYDKNLNSKVSDDYSRLTLNAKNVYRLFKDRLELSTDLYLVKNRSGNGFGGYGIKYPYEQVLDASGNALPVVRDYRQPAKDAFLGKGLLDWNYYPMQERFNQPVENKLTDYTLNMGLNYKLLPGILDIEGRYQYQQGNSELVITDALKSYSMRNQINRLSQIDPVTGVVTRPIPLGDMVNRKNGTYSSSTGRLQLNYHQHFGLAHEITALMGSEIKDYNSFNSKKRVYGYNPSTATDQDVDYFKDYPNLIGGGTDRISRGGGQDGVTDRSISYFANAAYTYRSKYTLSGSVRKDESNLFGVASNQKGIPLYSMGLSWELSKEDFYPIGALPYLKLRFTHGYNGNVSKTLSAYLTAEASYLNIFNSPTQAIVNPPNPGLRWEKVRVLNAGLDFALKNQVLSGSVEFYSKKGTDLIGSSPLEPQSGITKFEGNTASILTRGIDLSLHSINLRGELGWQTHLLFNYVKDKVLSYKRQAGSNSAIVWENYQNPMEGKPYSALFAYRWAGLDDKGDPQGYLDGQVSKDYSGITGRLQPDQLVYKGTKSPTYFGSLRNELSYKNFEFSFNLVYRLGYVFRRDSYSGELAGIGTDYDKRWQKPGDELSTIVPAVVYPNNSLRSSFYGGSEALVDQGDHIRLQDISLSYHLVGKGKFPFKDIHLAFTASNLGWILWRANKLGIDPDNVYSIPPQRVYGMSLSINL